jgi:hypothetical protein
MIRFAPLPKRLLCFFVFFALLLGGLSYELGRPAEAKAKKIVRKVKKSKIKHKIKKTTVKKKRAAKRSIKKAAVRKVAKKAAASQASGYELPAAGGTVSQTFLLEEGIGDPEVDNLVSAMKGIGASDAYADTSRNTLTITYNAAKLSSGSIIKKLKSLGYTAKRQS